MQGSKAGTREKRNPDGLPLGGHNNNDHNMLLLYLRWKKYNEIQLTKNKEYLNNRK